MDIKEYYLGLQTLKANKKKESNRIKTEIEMLETNPIVKYYNEKQRELTNLNYEYSENNYLNNIKSECTHPMYVFEYDLSSSDSVVPCARCLICGGLFYDIKDIELLELYNEKKLLAKKISFNNYNNSYDFGYINYKLSLNDLRKIYYKLSILSEDNTKFNTEEVLFNHLTGNNPNVRRRKK